MLSYSLLATLFLAFPGISGEWVGSLLWPAVAIHVILTFLMGGAYLSRTRGGGHPRYSPKDFL
jgi:hypothetical protein